MLALTICLVCFLATYLAARHALVNGLIAILATGYAYGIVRANVISPYSHFIFDASLAGLYLAQLLVGLSPNEKERSAALRGWLILLIGWPLLICFMPFQTFLVSLVGLRGNVFFLPLCLLAVRMTSRDWFRLSLALAALNTLALSFGAAEYFLGIEGFYPVSPVTAIIYASRDVGGFQFYRIPATFVNAHAYAGTMVTTLPLLMGTWSQPKLRFFQRWVLLSGLAAAATGILMANARSHVVAAGVVAVSGLLMTKMALGRRLVLCGMITGAGLLAFSNERFQRVASLTDTEAVEGRIQGSVNRTFLEILVEYPMGNGLGGGGTSIPSFLEGQVNKPVAMESEYARILLEQGIVGLLVWLGFVFRFFTSSAAFAPGEWLVARRLTWVCCSVLLATAMIGTGVLTSIPQTALMILGLGWVMVQPLEEKPGRSSLSSVGGRRPAYATLAS